MCWTIKIALNCRLNSITHTKTMVIFSVLELSKNKNSFIPIGKFWIKQHSAIGLLFAQTNKIYYSTKNTLSIRKYLIVYTKTV
jgi:hypothetical protein